jgi:HD-like signal output (HDOD) protein
MPKAPHEGRHRRGDVIEQTDQRSTAGQRRGASLHAGGAGPEAAGFDRSAPSGSTEHYAQSQLIGRLIANVPRLPVYACGLLGRINDPSSSSSDVAKVVREDPSLAAMILKTVNSPFYGFPAQIKDLQHAIALLGMAQVGQIVLSNAILSTMPKTPPFEELRVHSMAISFMAGELADWTGSPRPSAETLGLIHDVGRSVVLLLKDKHPSLELFFDLLNQDELGAMLFSHWNLPPDLCEIIRYQGLPQYLPPESLPQGSRTMLLLVALAHEVLDHLTCGASEGLFLQGACPSPGA